MGGIHRAGVELVEKILYENWSDDLLLDIRRERFLLGRGLIEYIACGFVQNPETPETEV